MTSKLFDLNGERPKTADGLSRYFSRTRGVIKPGAHRLQTLLSAFFGLGVLDFSSVLVTGTNGKGTVCALLESAVRSSGFRTGLYTSPHLVSPVERIRVGGVPISEEMMEAALTEVERAMQSLLPDATFFEIATAAAFLAFAWSRIDFLVAEVGLGGLYDSTNALAPRVGVLTGVGLEHTEYLGDTLKKIAADKSFVSRRNAPFVVGQLQDEALAGVSETLNVTGAHLVSSATPLPSDWETLYNECVCEGSPWLKVNKGNLRVAVTALWALVQNGMPFSLENIKRGILKAFWPGRFDARQISGRTVIFDAAHNSSGFDFFMEQMAISQWSGQKLTVVYGSLSDKDWHKIVPRLPEIADFVVFSQPTSERAVDALDLAKVAPAGLSHKVVSPLKQALTEALSLGTGPLLVIGSIALIGEAMELLNISPLSREAFYD